VDAIDVHFHIVPQRFVDLVRGQALREIVAVERAADVDRLQFRPPPGIAIEPDTAIRPHLYDPGVSWRRSTGASSTRQPSARRLSFSCTGCPQSSVP